jgi:hypothetical protein
MVDMGDDGEIADMGKRRCHAALIAEAEQAAKMV